MKLPKSNNEHKLKLRSLRNYIYDNYDGYIKFRVDKFLSSPKQVIKDWKTLKFYTQYTLFKRIGISVGRKKNIKKSKYYIYRKNRRCV